MTFRDHALKLRCRDGHFEMAAFELRTRPEGFWMWVACDFAGHQGGHWLCPDAAASERVAITEQPYAWHTAVGAFAARDRWEQQQED